MGTGTLTLHDNDFHVLPIVPKSAYLDAFPPTERQHIVALAAEVADDLDRWATRFPLIRKVRIQPLALSVAASTPFETRAALLSTARVSLWVFTVDDVFDEKLVSDRELVRRANEYRAIARRGQAASFGDELAVALTEIVADIASYPLYGTLGAVWTKAIEGTIDGMFREDLWRHDFARFGRRALPTYREYLTAGQYSIGGPPHVWSSVITSGDLTATMCFDLIHAMERTACICIRLANDLRSDQKEAAEGKVNSIGILAAQLQDLGWPVVAAREEAIRRIGCEIDRGLKRLDRFYAHSATRTGRPEAAIRNIARFVCEFYARYDYHTFVPGRSRAVGVA